ncbi:DUF72 domain-containing protein [Adhaeribacter radiodurans]|uniref:DUF72 domain-containing protein n=1 Tax=Adhaeribacter radiodurans TaxID=2745197 RepID=A0A7L7L4W1_9BACT|nr:DUF72 domain-containing protein [Adhaeribacter radiodurans]QMU27836.1 DUF72 domain-containing protein [Adhaeribacter radiodurans]
MAKAHKIWVGCSGWHYKHWKGIYYPAGTPQPEFLNFYLQDFSTVEINNSFYRLPTPETFANWYQSVPEDFLFAVKASRFITHMKKLKDPQQSFSKFMENVAILREKLGPILFQLPPNWQCDIVRFEGFLQALPPYFRYTFEFRDHSWYNENVYELLQIYQATFCIYDLEYHVSPILVTSNFVYIRLHGPLNKYDGSYSEETLQEWAKRCKTWQQEGKEVFVYFDNDMHGYAPFNARRLQELVQE